MANYYTSERSKSMTHIPGIRFQFVDKQERRNPKCHLRTIVRSNARKHTVSTRRAFNAHSVHLRRFGKRKDPGSILNSREDGLYGVSCSTDPGHSSGHLGVNHPPIYHYEILWNFRAFKIMPFVKQERLRTIKSASHWRLNTS
jgi:hypothetical protein